MATKVIQLEGGETYRHLYFRKARMLNVEVFRRANVRSTGSASLHGFPSEPLLDQQAQRRLDLTGSKIPAEVVA